MKGISLRDCVSALLLMTLPAATMFAEPAATAMMLAKGHVLVNGTSISRSSAILQGDTVETQQGSVVLSLAGSSLSIPENSRLAFQRNGIRLYTGGAMINTRQALSTHTTRIHIAPASSPAIYQVAKSGNQVIIVAKRGDLAVGWCRTFTLAEGHTVVLDDNENGACPPGLPPILASMGMSKGVMSIIGLSAAVPSGLCAYYCGSHKENASETQP